MTEEEGKELRRRARLLQNLGGIFILVGVVLSMSGIHLGTATTGTDGRLHFDAVERVWSLFRGILPPIGAVLIVVGWVRERRAATKQPDEKGSG